ncbi:MAG: hypothetical protein WCC69_12395 [Pirellulales bacterium]
MDETVTGLLADLDALGIAIKEERGEVSIRPKPPPDLLDRLKRHKDALAQAVWARDAGARQAKAIERLAADRRAWVEENKRLGRYRGPD